MDSHHLILGGDTNCVLSPNLDRSSSKTSSDSKSAQTIQLFLQAYGVVESGVSSTLHLGAIPFFPPVHKTFSRIDYFFIDKKLLPMVTACEYQSIVISDHAPLNMKLRVPSADSS